MPLTFSVSTTSLEIQNTLKDTQSALQKSMQRLASGLKVSSAADGAANMAISTSLDTTIRGYGVASSNIQQGLSMLGSADTALQNVVSHLQNIRDIAVAASNSTNSTSDFANYQAQSAAEIASINNIANNTKFGTNILLDGSVSGGAAFNIQIGANSGDTLDIKAAFTDNKAATLTVAQSIGSAANATTLLGQVDAALTTVYGNLATVGGYQNRLTDQLSNLDVAKTNTAASLSSIRNTDVAEETANLTRLQILQQAGAYALAQANTAPQIALTLLPH